MNDKQLQRRLLFILHRGLVEARMLSQSNKAKQVLELADALESVPSYMNSWEESYMQVVRFNLSGYRQKYPDATFDYTQYLDVDPPKRF